MNLLRWLLNRLRLLLAAILRLLGIGPRPLPNRPPDVRIDAPTGGTVNAPVRIAYTLTDAESDPVRVEVTFSRDGGASFAAATEAAGAGSEGTTALSSSPGGVPHVFVWDAMADIGGRETRDPSSSRERDPLCRHSGAAREG